MLKISKSGVKTPVNFFGLDRRLVCKRCHCIMRDIEPAMKHGEFWHEDNDCKNAGKTFSWPVGHYKEDAREVEMFMRKSTRRWLNKQR